MAGFFSLGSATYHSQQDPTTYNTNTNPTSDPSTRRSSSWLLYGTTTRNIHDTTTKDFDFWQQPPVDASNLLAQASRASMGGGGDGDDHGRFINFSNDPTWGSAAVVMMGHSSGGGGVSCRDCGNQAKKDCTHMRCRTCCKSRGFQCQTHVKSTWVPVTKRRERQQYLSATQQDHNRRRLLPTTQNTRSAQDPENPNFTAAAAGTGSVAYNSSSGMEIGNFPSEVTTQADFRCIRVSSIDEADYQFAFQAAVNIRGHLFKGILYDQGPEGQYMSGDNTSSGGCGQLNLTSISPGNSTVGANFIGQFALLGGNDYLTSTQFFHQISRD